MCYMLAAVVVIFKVCDCYSKTWWLSVKLVKVKRSGKFSWSAEVSGSCCCSLGLWASVLGCVSWGLALQGCVPPSDPGALGASQAAPEGGSLFACGGSFPPGWQSDDYFTRETGVLISGYQEERQGTHPSVIEWRRERRKLGPLYRLWPLDPCSGAMSLPDCSSHLRRNLDAKS